MVDITQLQSAPRDGRLKLEAEEVCLRVGVDATTIAAWAEAGWLSPQEGYSEIDVARARLIRDLRDDLGVNDEAVDVILDLVDQIHGLRQALQMLTAADRLPP
jgi:chaperone modulatory protein CbpM